MGFKPLIPQIKEVLFYIECFRMNARKEVILKTDTLVNIDVANIKRWTT